jgi:hypothetical protein
MTRSKIIPASLAALCGLALQFHVGVAHAQCLPGCLNEAAFLYPGQALLPGQALRSYTGYLFVLQQDGNLVLYNPSNTPIWSTPNTYDFEPMYLLLDYNGLLTLYSFPANLIGSPQPVWSTNTPAGLATLVLLPNGNLVITNLAPGNEPAWQTGTAGK